MAPVNTSIGYVLHKRPYREHSALVEILTLESGRLTVVARERQGRQSSLGALLQPAQPLYLNLSGHGELLTLRGAEPLGLPYRLEGEALFSLFYIHELLLTLLPKAAVQDGLFILYEDLLRALTKGNKANLHRGLRCFEYQLLRRLGYGIPLEIETQTGRAVDPKGYYQVNGLGQIVSVEKSEDAYLGSVLLAYEQDELYWRDASLWNPAKRFMRRQLAPLLGGRTFKSKALYT